MSPDEASSWRSDLSALRKRLDFLEKRSREEMGEISAQIERLERRLAAEEKVGPVVEESGVVVMPPPLPVQAVVPKAVPPVRPVMKEEGPPKEAKDGFEFRLGRVWLVRVGIVMLLTGLVLLGNYAYQNWVRDLPNGVRLLGLVACAAGLAEAGRRLSAKVVYERVGEVILAGGLSLFYYCVFAAYHVPRLKVIDHPALAAVLLFAAAGMIGAVAWFRNNRSTAVLGILLASYSTMLQPVGWLSCLSSVLLAGAGVALMSRPGWVLPGVAAMAGTYGAFFGWQLMGASGGNVRDPAVLWYLPPVWAMFALPAVLGRFSAAMTDRAKAWFAGGNNGVFFGLFAWIWYARGDGDLFWLVCLLFGLVLLGLGVTGRRQGSIAGGVNLSQGLGLVTFAGILKLEGFHLPLALALEACVLAGAFRRFRGKTELVFSVLAAVGAMMWIMFPVWTGVGEGLGENRLWVSGVAGMLLGVAAWLVGDGEGARGRILVFFPGLVVAVAGWAFGLPGSWPLAAVMGLTAGLSLWSPWWDGKMKRPEVAAGALGAAVSGVAWLVFKWMESGFRLSDAWGEWWIVAIAAGLVWLAGWIWHLPAGGKARVEGEYEGGRMAGEWMLCGMVALLSWLVTVQLRLDFPMKAIVPGLAGAGWIGVGVVSGQRRLLPGVAVLGLAGVLPTVVDPLAEPWPLLAAAGVALGSLALLRWGKRETRDVPELAGVLVRITAFLAATLFWHEWAPGHFGDGMALTSAGLLAGVYLWKGRWVWESVGFLALGGMWLLQGFGESWGRVAEPTWRGWGVVAALGLWSVICRLGRREEGKNLETLMGWVAWGFAAAWSTQMLVWRWDWYGAAVLWAVLGFVAVCSGLWWRSVAYRQVGLGLLALAVIKVFAMDVWDFNKFMRVVAFIVLGGAMVLLGLFYNRFAPMVKRLVDEGEGPENGTGDLK